MGKKPQFSAGGRYRTRTCDILGVNGSDPRKSALFSPASKAISPLCGASVPVAFGGVVQSGTAEPLVRYGC